MKDQDKTKRQPNKELEVLRDELVERKKAETKRKPVKEALRPSEETFKSLAGNANDGIFVSIGKGLYAYANQRASEMTGYSVAELLKSGIEDLMHSDELKKIMERYRKRIAGEPLPSPYETTIIRKDGESLPIALTAARTTWRGQPADLVIIRDITERKQAEAALKEKEDFLNNIIEQTPNPIWISDKQGTVIRINQALRNLLKITDEEIIGKYNVLKDVQVKEQGLLPLIQTVFEKGKTVNFTIDYHTEKEKQVELAEKTYKVLDIVIAPIKNKEGEIAHAICQHRDITERKRTEDALRESEERYRMLVETSPDAVTLLDLNLNIVTANRPALVLYGYENLREVIGQSAFDFIASEDRPRAAENARKMLETESIETFEYTLLKKGGIPFPAEVRASLILNVEKKPLVFICVTRDISARKQGEEERAVLEDQLRQSQKMEAIGQLAGGVAHDFNNLLTVIKGYSQLSLAEVGEGNPFREAFEVINKAVEKATDLTRQLLAFSRRQIMEVRVLDLNALLQNLDKMLRRIIGEDIELVTLLGEDLGRVKADPGQIEQAVMNLAVNAKDAMSEGGKLIIETVNAELDEAYARTHVAVTPGPYVMIAVSDTGTGMRPEVRDRIFEPFFTTKGKGKGTGLGLSTVYGIVKQSNGNIWVYSEPGKGTTFKIFLPRVDEPAEKLKAQEADDELSRGSETILVVEDDKEVRNLAVRILKRQGYTVLDGSYGDEAFSVCRQHKGPIHLLLTDVVMPGMDGRALSDCLSQLHPEMKVLYMSGYTDDAIVRHGVMAKGTNYIQKPFTVNGLTKKVREALEQ